MNNSDGEVRAAGNSPRLLMIELNEFDPTYLETMAERLGLANVRRVLSMAQACTTTADEVEHQGLDPWVQWAGIHSGKPTADHNIRRLGATRMQPWPQIWHEVAQRGHSWGVWGVMNAPMGSPEGCRFFMPDPWSFDENAYPRNLNDLLALPRYAAKNYLDVEYRKAAMAGLRLARFFAPPNHWGLLARFAAAFSRAMVTTGPSVHAFTTLLDYLSVLCFVRLRRKLRPDLSIIFLNHIAHLQHQFWSGGVPHPEMKLGLRLCDAMLGLLLADRIRDEAILLMNGLKQANVAGMGFYVYRQINPQSAIEALGIKEGHVEQCMTHDAIIVFSSCERADQAIALLDKCYLSDGHKAFYVERQGSDRVFYQLAFEHHVSADCRLICGNWSVPFYDTFQLVCERTGAHVPRGDIYYDGLELPQSLANHDVFRYVVSHFESHETASVSA